MIKQFTTDDNYKRAELFVARSLDISRNQAEKLLLSQKVKRGSGEVAKKGSELQKGDTLLIELADVQPMPNIEIIYENENIIVASKPAGVLTHSKGDMSKEFDMSMLVDKYFDGGGRSGIVHRLDRATSGVLVMAKDKLTAAFLRDQFAQRSVDKTYRAVAEKAMKDAVVKVDAPIVRSPKKSGVFRVHSSGKPAVTTLRGIGTNTEGQAQIEAKPITGRTHQIRVHLNYIGSPVLGDELYGQAKWPRMMLHAHKIELDIGEGKRMVFISQLPEGF